MKVLYIHQYFNTPDEGGSIRSYLLARELVKKGVEVELITAHSTSEATKEIEGIRVHYLHVSYDNSLNYKNRVLAFLKFVFLAIKKTYTIKGVDVCYVMTTPLTTGLIALWMKWVRRKPYIFEVGDLWPLVPIEMGILKSKISQLLLFWFEKLCYRQASGLVGLSPDIADHIGTLAPGRPVEIIPNISDTFFFRLEVKSDLLKKRYNLNEEFVISYTGTFGRANHLKYLLDAAKICIGLPVRFLIVGDGAENVSLQEMKETNGLNNVDFWPSTNKEGVREILNVSDAVYISFADVPSLWTGSPNKLFDGLAAGKLIITNFGGWVSDLIKSNDAGFSHDPKDLASFQEKLLLFINNKSILQSFQNNARKLAENSFSLDRLSERQLKFIQNN